MNSNHALWISGHKGHSEDAERRIESAYRCLKHLRGVVPMETVVDFGCGIGAWMHAAHKMGAKVVKGIEGEWITQAEVLVPREAIEVHDLETDIPDLNKAFDLAMTIEVAEHLKAAAAPSFIKALTQASNYVLFSAAIPGQTGVGHVNEQPLGYWVEKFWTLKYVPLEPIRPFISEDRHIYGWLRQNLVMFVSYTEFLRNERLHRWARPLKDFELRYPQR